MSGLLTVVTLSLVVGLVAATGPCNVPYTKYDKYLKVLPAIGWYLPQKYDHNIAIFISCTKLHLYDNDKKEFVDGKSFTTKCWNGKYDPDIGNKRFSCKELETGCKLELTPYLIADPPQTTFKKGKLVEFSCKAGYYLVGAIDAICLRSGEFSEDIPTCRPYCRKPAPQPYLEIDYDKRSFKRGGSIDLSCETGYRLKDDAEQTRFCLSNGKWDPEIEDDLCERTGCRNPPRLENGKYTPEKKEYYPDKDGWFVVGAKLIYECDKYYYLKGKNWMACGSNGIFHFKVPVCIEIRCDEPMEIDNGVFGPKKDTYSIGEYVVYKCNTNYKFSKSTSGRRFCKSNNDGKTASFEKEPQCERIECDKPADIGNGGFKAATGPYYVSDKVTYFCNPGFYLAGNDKAVCLLNKDKMTASFTPAPVCKPILCDKPMQPDKGDFSPKQTKYGLGETVDFTCIENYYRSGPETATCVEDTATKGKFTKIPTCIEVRCLKPKILSNGGFSPEEDSYPVDDSITYFCDTNYKLVPKNGKRVCMLNRDGKTASFPQAPICERIECSDPDDIKDGSFSPKQKNWYVGNKVTYECDDGYYLVGSAVRECELSKDKMSAAFKPAPRCERIICEDPMDLKYGEISKGVKDEYYIGDTVMYKCDYKYYLSGIDSAKCIQTGEKTGKFTKAPSCIEIFCRKPMDIDDGSFSPENAKYPIGDEVTYDCDDNFKRVGPRKAICEKTGSKTAKFTEAPVCEEILCDEPMELDNGDFVTDPKEPFVVGTVIKYKCDRGYEFATKFTTTTCKLEKDAMSAKFTALPVCKRVYCTMPEKPANGGIIDGKSEYYVDEMVMFYCDGCYRLHGFEKATCQQNGKFDKEVPSCVLRKCLKGAVSIPDDGSFDPIKPTYNCGEYITFSCHEAFNLVYDVKSQCQPDGSFSVKKKTFCDPIICKRPKLNVKVRVRPNRREYNYRNVIEYYCVPGYSVIETDKTEAICQKDGTFSNPSITCKPNRCGRPPVPKYGYIVDDPDQDYYDPGDEVEYMCNEWYTLEDGGFNECQNDGSWKYPAPKCLPPSCKGQCLSKPKKGRPCQCDYKCKERYDCCDDRDRHCIPYSCGDRCGKPVPGGCSCDPRCTKRQTKDCCRDYYQACPGSWYLFPSG